MCVNFMVLFCLVLLLVLFVGVCLFVCFGLVLVSKSVLTVK